MTLDRTGNTGWIEVDNLSTSKVAVRRYRKAGAKPGAEPETPEAAPAGETPASPSVVGPKPAEAGEAPPKKAPSRPKVRPEMFDAF